MAAVLRAALTAAIPGTVILVLPEPTAAGRSLELGLPVAFTAATTAFATWAFARSGGPCIAGAGAATIRS